MRETWPVVKRDGGRPWLLSAVSIGVTVLGPVLGALVALRYFESGTRCKDGWLALVAVSYLILVVPSAVSVVLAHVGLHRGRAANGASSMPGVVGVVLAWCVFVLVAGVAGVFALMMILFTGGLPC